MIAATRGLEIVAVIETAARRSKREHSEGITISSMPQQ